MKDRIQSLVGKAFDGRLSGAVKEFTAERVTVGEYNPTTGETPKTRTPYSGRGVFGGFRIEEIEGTEILMTDTKLTALQNEVEMKPQEGDTIKGLKVIRIRKDPFESIWIIALRRT